MGCVGQKTMSSKELSTEFAGTWCHDGSIMARHPPSCVQTHHSIHEETLRRSCERLWKTYVLLTCFHQVVTYHFYCYISVAFLVELVTLWTWFLWYTVLNGYKMEFNHYLKPLFLYVQLIDIQTSVKFLFWLSIVCNISLLHIVIYMMGVLAQHHTQTHRTPHTQRF